MKDNLYNTVTNIILLFFVMVAMVWGTYADSTLLKINAKLDAMTVEIVRQSVVEDQDDMDGSMQCLCVTSMGAP